VFDSLPTFRTTDKRPASHLIPKSYRTDYNALEDYCYHRLTVLVLLPSLPSLDPLIELICHRGASVQVQALPYSVVKVLFVFLAISSNKRKLWSLFKRTYVFVFVRRWRFQD
jgi:hypothetical protein